MFDIRLDENDFNRVMKALDGIEKAVKKEAANLSRESAITYRFLLTDAILRNKFDYQPYTEKYAREKKKDVGHLKFWLYHGALLHSIAAQKVGTDSWSAGITPGALNREGRQPKGMTGRKTVKVEVYAPKVERERPLFSQIRKEFIAPTGEWERLGKQALLKTIKHWKG